MVFVFTIMMLYYNKVDKDGLLWKVTEYPWKAIAAVFFVLDILYNYVMTIWMLDVPATWDEPVSYRMDRYIAQYKDSNNLLNKWRYGFAKGLCTVLSYSDPKHCGGI
jgi:hypothetical protein